MKVAEVAVGIEPWCVAITPNNAKVHVANMASGEVKVINRATRSGGQDHQGGDGALWLRA